MPRKSSPALYELIRTRPETRRSPSRPAVRDDHPPSDEPMPSTLAWLSPGRVLQVPVGYVFVAIAIAIVLFVTGYMVGHQRGESSALLIYEDEYGPILSHASERARAADPLQQPRAGATDDIGDGVRPQTLPQPTGGTGSEARGWGPIESDPREPGKNYFVLIETRLAGARRLAEFGREHGLETYVVPANTARNRRVIVLPGYAAGERSSPEIQRLERQLDRVGTLWKESEPGAADFSGRYPLRFGG